MRDCAWPTKPTELMIALARLLMKANFANFDREVVQIRWLDLKETKKVLLLLLIEADNGIVNNEKGAKAADETRNAKSKNIAITTLKSTAVAPNGPTKWPNV